MPRQPAHGAVGEKSQEGTGEKEELTPQGIEQSASSRS
jgi:hypothetical protein